MPWARTLDQSTLAALHWLSRKNAESEPSEGYCKPLIMNHYWPFRNHEAFLSHFLRAQRCLNPGLEFYSLSTGESRKFGVRISLTILCFWGFSGPSSVTERVAIAPGWNNLAMVPASWLAMVCHPPWLDKPQIIAVVVLPCITHGNLIDWWVNHSLMG